MTGFSPALIGTMPLGPVELFGTAGAADAQPQLPPAQLTWVREVIER